MAALKQSGRVKHVPVVQPDDPPSSPDISSEPGFPHALSDVHFRMLVDAVQDYAIFMLDPRGRVASWNRGAQSIKGYAAGEIVGQHFSVFYTPDDIAIRKPETELAQAAIEDRIEDEGWRVRKDGTQFWASVTITAIRAPDGALQGFAKVTRDMTDRLRLIELQHARAMSIHVQNAREEERARLARELHDDLGQQLIALKMDVASLDRASLLEYEELHRVKAHSAHLQGKIDTIIASARRLAGGLRPPMLDDLGLEAALEWLADEFRSRYDLVVTVNNNAGPLDLSAPAATAVFRLVQEALTNVTRHAEATWVRIEIHQTHSSLHLHIEDNGKGAVLDGNRSKNSFGLLGMQERVHELKGRIAFESAPSDGFRIHIELPLDVATRKIQ
ncbi:histidine kinase [Burkholderia sp. Leaf177]|uniref:PAS domain-containing sensor histidine kinase n=1 Tax=Burkholderia sp. Leaf177 TaxID=1736287 RepID=UPI0006F84D31|nr:PAS domain S-box protein [Burkholderia sp. Leaf177]KQR73678.1 histidine kinase [Burkholderia sp. Leaf177]